MTIAFLYVCITVLLIIFGLSIASIPYFEKYIGDLKEENEKKEKNSNNLFLDKMVSFSLPAIAFITFFISCYLVSKVLYQSSNQGPQKYLGIYFLLLVTILFFIFNNTVLEDNKIQEYIKGKKFSVMGVIMISGVSALLFGFIDNFGLSLGIEALDNKFLQLFLGPFSADKRFIPEKKAISRNLIHMNNWSRGKWRSVINHTLRFKEDIRKIKGTQDLMRDIDEFIKDDKALPLEIPKRIRDTNLVKEFVNNIKSKYDTIEDSKAMIGNTFSNFIGAMLGAAILNLFTYMTKYDATYTGDDSVDDNIWVKNLKSYVPLLEGVFMIIGCFMPVLLIIAMKRDINNNNNTKAWVFLALVASGLFVMLYLSVKGISILNTSDKKKSLQKTITDMKNRLDITDKLEPSLNHEINLFLQKLVSI